MWKMFSWRTFSLLFFHIQSFLFSCFFVLHLKTVFWIYPGGNTGSFCWIFEVCIQYVGFFEGECWIPFNVSFGILELLTIKAATLIDIHRSLCRCSIDNKEVLQPNCGCKWCYIMSDFVLQVYSFPQRRSFIGFFTAISANVYCIVWWNQCCDCHKNSSSMQISL